MTKKEQEDLPVATTAEANAGWMQSSMERLARTAFGQIVLKQLDRFLWIVEKCAEWSLPQDEAYLNEEENGTPSKRELVRPLPWILFLPSLIILRSIRMTLNIGAFLFGFPKIQPSIVVKFTQKSRRWLKVLRSPNGSSGRTRFKRKDKRLSMNEAKKALIRSIRLTLSTLSCLDGSKPSLSPPPTRIHISALDLDAASTPEEKSATESAGSPKHTAKQKHTATTSSDSSDDSTEETLEAKIDRLALESSTDDPDYIPAACTASSSNDEDGDNENDLNVSQDELHNLTEDTRSLLDAETIKQQQDSEQRMLIKEDRNKAECDLSTDSREFQTPTKFSQDGDAHFYSPISSSSDTPERSASPTTVQKHHSCEEINNGAVVEKRSTNTNKYHHRGKRTTHGNRKKK